MLKFHKNEQKNLFRNIFSKGVDEIDRIVCDSCGSSNVDVLIIGVSVKPDYLDNSDLDSELQKKFDRLPTKRKAIMDNAHRVSDGIFFVECKDCGKTSMVNKDTNPSALRTWAKKNCASPLSEMLNRIL